MNLMTLIKERLSADQQQALENEIRASDPLTPAQRAQLVKDLQRIADEATPDLAEYRARQRLAKERIDELFRKREAAVVQAREIDREAAQAASQWARRRAPIEHQLRQSAASAVSAFGRELLDLHDRERALTRRGGFVDQVEHDTSMTGRKIPKPESVARVEEQQARVADYLAAIVEAYRSLDTVALTAVDPERAVNEIRQRLAAMRRGTRLEPWRGR
jgi:hypothetical protein